MDIHEYFEYLGEHVVGILKFLGFGAVFCALLAGGTFLVLAVIKWPIILVPIVIVLLLLSPFLRTKDANFHDDGDCPL